MIKTIEKDKIPKKYGFVLKTTQLENLLLDNDIDIHTYLDYTFPNVTGTIFKVHFRLPNDRVPYNRLSISAGALLKEDISLAREKMTEIVLPEFVVWVKNILALPSNSTHLYMEAYFDATFQENELKIYKKTY